MSELTRCNRCTLDSIIRREGKENVKVQASHDFPGWTEVLVRGERVASFMELTARCAC